MASGKKRADYLCTYLGNIVSNMSKTLTFDWSKYRFLCVYHDNSTTAAYNPTMIPIDIIVNNDRNFFVYGDSTAKYFYIKYSSGNSFSIVTSALSANNSFEIYGIG